MNSPTLDRLALLIVTESQANRLMKHLNRDGFQFTVINSTGGLGQDAVICLLIGFKSERMQALVEDVRQECRPYRQFIPTQGLLPSEAGSLPLLEVQAGGALVYTMNVERFEQF
jgi:uncharacterized protein YaaQ